MWPPKCALSWFDPDWTEIAATDGRARMNAAKYRPRQRHWAYSIKLQSASVEHSEARIYTQNVIGKNLGFLENSVSKNAPPQHLAPDWRFTPQAWTFKLITVCPNKNVHLLFLTRPISVRNQPIFTAFVDILNNFCNFPYLKFHLEYGEIIVYLRCIQFLREVMEIWSNA